MLSIIVVYILQLQSAPDILAYGNNQCHAAAVNTFSISTSHVVSRHRMCVSASDDRGSPQVQGPRQHSLPTSFQKLAFLDNHDLTVASFPHGPFRPGALSTSHVSGKLPSLCFNHSLL